MEIAYYHFPHVREQALFTDREGNTGHYRQDVVQRIARTGIQRPGKTDRLRLDTCRGRILADRIRAFAENRDQNAEGLGSGAPEADDGPRRVTPLTDPDRFTKRFALTNL